MSPEKLVMFGTRVPAGWVEKVKAYIKQRAKEPRAYRFTTRTLFMEAMDEYMKKHKVEE